MDLDPTKRFSSRINDYIRYRPSYPKAVIDLLVRECGLTGNSQIADVGSGTGLLSERFLEFGCEVFGVEPNADMRHASERLLVSRPRFRTIDGRAEATTLLSRSVDFVTAGQAFHWFDPAKTSAEFRRILRHGGSVVLVWNERVNTPGFMAEYENLVVGYGPERPSVGTDEIDSFFGVGMWRLETLANEQRFDLEGLRGRFLSSSYAPLPGTPSNKLLMKELGILFEKYQNNDLVTLSYKTLVYYGGLE